MIDELAYQRLKQEHEALQKAVTTVTAQARAESAVEFSSRAMHNLLQEISAEVGVVVPPFIVEQACARLDLAGYFGEEAVQKASHAINRREHING